MDPSAAGEVEAAEIVLPCTDLDATSSFFVARLGFRLDTIHPADDPRVAVVSGHGVRVRLERGAQGSAGVLRLLCRDAAAFAGGAAELVAPNGTRVQIVAADPPPDLPPLRASLVVSRARADAPAAEGRAGMRYRDLVPDRQGGRFIVSHIAIPAGGPVPDYVHFHKVRFQLIYCVKGWVRVVYEDQGAPFVLVEGDCVLQPPGIRHRVLESSPGLEVVEIASPAEHPTFVEHRLRLPTSEVRPEREFDGQCFIHHRSAGAAWRPAEGEGFEARDLGLGRASRGVVGGRVLRTTAVDARLEACDHDAELLFRLLLTGEAELRLDGAAAAERLRAGDAFVVPAGLPHAVAACGAALELLEIRVPASFAMATAQVK
jgi:quercetin dioxygenase-like cupin family protein